MRKLWSLFGRVLELGSILSFLGLVGVVLLQVYARLFLPKSPHWTEEASRFLFIYTVSFASGLVIREKAFVNVDVFTNMLPKPAQRWLQILLDLLVAGFMAVVFYYSLKNLGIGRMQTSASLRVPMHYIFASMSVLSGTVVLFSLASVVRDVRLAAGGGN
jgi:TRAP-type C4-dicarboxylate transport system permease small subunit